MRWRRTRPPSSSSGAQLASLLTRDLGLAGQPREAAQAGRSTLQQLPARMVRDPQGAEPTVDRQNVLADLLQPAYRALRTRYLHVCQEQLLRPGASWQLLEAVLFCVRCAASWPPGMPGQHAHAACTCCCLLPGWHPQSSSCAAAARRRSKAENPAHACLQPAHVCMETAGTVRQRAHTCLGPSRLLQHVGSAPGLEAKQPCAQGCGQRRRVPHRSQHAQRQH